MAANTEEVVEAPQEASNETTEELATPKQEDITQTQNFARRLKEESRKQSAKAVDDFVASMNIVNEVTGEQVKTQADYQKYMRTIKAQDDGKDPIMFNELEEAKSRYDSLQVEYNRLKRAEDIRELQNDPEWSETYELYKDDIDAILAEVDKDPDKYRGVTPKIALQSLLVNASPNKLIQQTKTKASTETMKSIQSKAKASPGKLGGGEAPKGLDFGSMSDAEFDKYLIRAKRGDLKGNIFG